MKKPIILSMFLIVSVACLSQRILLSAGGELAFPGSHSGLSMNAGTGFGGSLRFESTCGKFLSLIATVSSLSFSSAQPYSSAPTTTTKVKAVPIEVGIKYYPSEIKEKPKGVFVSLGIGNISTTTHFTYAVNPAYNFKESGFACAPGIGYLLENIEANFRIQYDLRASGFHTYYYNLRIGYIFLKGKWKK